MKLSNSDAKAGPISEEIALGLTYVPLLDFDHFESQADSPRLNQRLPSNPEQGLFCVFAFVMTMPTRPSVLPLRPYIQSG